MLKGRRRINGRSGVLYVALAALWIAGLACTLPGLGANPTESGGPSTLPPGNEASPTPFIPQPPTGAPEVTPSPMVTLMPTLSPTPMDPWGNFPAPIQPSAIDIAPPMPHIDFPDDVINFIVLGSDQRPNTGGYRTDTIMIISLDPGTNSATLLSIPRDLYVYIPGWRVDRINTAAARGGLEMLSNTIEYNFGIEIDHSVQANFGGFTDLVDSLGGISVESTGYLNDECGGVQRIYGTGTYHMDGFEALCYVRMRKTSSDFDRLRRQQEVAQAIFNRLLTLDGLTRVPELYSQFRDDVQTNTSLDTLLSLVPLASRIATGSGEIRRFAVDRTMATGWRVPVSGAAVLLPNRQVIQEMLLEAFAPYAVASIP